MYSGISGMRVNQTKLDVIGNNIANVGTTAFKSSQARFKDMLYQNAGEATAPTTVLGGTNAKQVGLGAQLSSINKMMGQGNALSTGRRLDVCIDGDGYLVVAKGDVTGAILVDQKTGLAGDTTDGGGGTDTEVGTLSETLYTRDGNLTLDYQGNLLTADGHRVMGYYMKNDDQTDASIVYATEDNADTGVKKGEPYANYVNADSSTLAVTEDNSLHPLAIPDSVLVDGKADPVKKFEIGKDGIVTAVLGSGKRAALGQVAMASFKNPEGLTDLGGNMCLNSSNSGPTVYKTGKNVTGTDVVDNAGGFGSLLQGSLEGSNVDLTEQFTDMITATRSFQAASKMITTGDEILQTITGLMR